jgi:hypothetical protein
VLDEPTDELSMNSAYCHSSEKGPGSNLFTDGTTVSKSESNLSFASQLVCRPGWSSQCDGNSSLKVQNVDAHSSARNLTDCCDGFLLGTRLLILDRDRKYSEGFRNLLEEAGTGIVRLPARSPNLNAFAERFVLSVKSECLDRMILFGEASLRRAVHQYLAHYHRERNHQGLDNGLIEPAACVDQDRGKVECRERLGGMLKYYYRAAA